jgi:hypothetical protein
VVALASAQNLWEELMAANHTPEMLAILVYQPLAEGNASKAVTRVVVTLIKNRL